MPPFDLPCHLKSGVPFPGTIARGILLEVRSIEVLCSLWILQINPLCRDILVEYLSSRSAAEPMGYAGCPGFQDGGTKNKHISQDGMVD